MPELICIGEIWLNPSQIQYFRLSDRGQTITLYFSGRSLAFSGKQKDHVMRNLGQHQPSPATATTALLTPPTMRRRA